MSKEQIEKIAKEIYNDYTENGKIFCFGLEACIIEHLAAFAQDGGMKISASFAEWYFKGHCPPEILKWGWQEKADYFIKRVYEQ